MAAVTRQKSGPDQLEDFLRRILTAVDTPAPTPEVPAVEKLSPPPPVISPPEPAGLEQMSWSFLAGLKSERSTSSS